MAKNLGTFTFAANFQVKAAEALDPRMVAASKADLIQKSNWPSDGDTIYVYKGLIVDCGDDGVYRLIDPAKALNADYSGWERIDAGGVKIDNIFTYKGSVASFENLPQVKDVGDVYNVETAFTIGDKEYPAGTNVAWNGSDWDPLAGSVDLSTYASKEEVAGVRATANSNAENIQNLSTSLGETNAAVANKVEKRDGYDLISSEDLALIEATAGQVGTLTGQAANLTTRVESLESFFSDDSIEGGGLSLADVNAAIAALQTDKADKSDVTTLSGTVGEMQTALAEAIALNAEQTTYISNLQQAVTTLTNTYNEGITGLTATVNSHTESIGKNTTDISNLTTLVNTINSDYLKAADIESKLDASVYEAKIAELVKADSDNLQEAKDYADSAASAVNTLLDAEIARAKAAEKEVADAVQAEKARIDAILTSEGVSEAVESFKELQAWIDEHEGGAADILAAANAAQEAASNAQKDVDALELIVADIPGAYAAADAIILQSAKDYTDQQIASLSIANYATISYVDEEIKDIKDTTYTKEDTDAAINAAVSAAFEWVDINNE